MELKIQRVHPKLEVNKMITPLSEQNKTAYRSLFLPHIRICLLFILYLLSCNSYETTAR